MKKVFSILVIIAAIAVIAGANSVCAAPRLTISEPAFDFGFVPQHSAICHKFWLLSTGDDSLKILNVIPGCGCTKAPLKTNLIAAGDSTELEVIFSTKSYRNRVTKTPTIETNEGPPNKRVTIHSTVVTRPDSTYPLIINPYKLDLSSSSEKTVNKMEFTIQNVSDAKLEVKLVSTDGDYFEVEIPSSIGAGKTGNGEIKLNESVVGESFEKSFTIELNDEAKSRFTVPIKRTVSLAGPNTAAKNSSN